MNKRNAKIQNFITPNTSKNLCAKFSKKTQNMIVSGDNKGIVSLWHLTKDQPITTFNSQSASQNIIPEISAVCFSADEKEIFSGTNRGSVSIWDASEQKLITTLRGHSAAISCISAFPNPRQSNQLITAACDSTLKLWDLRQKEVIMTFKGHNLPVNDVEIAPDGRWLASGDQDSRIKLWDITSAKCFQTFDSHTGPITCLRFNPDDLTLVSGSADKTIRYWDLQKFSLIWTSKTDATPVQKLMFNTDGRRVFAASQEMLKVWSVNTDELMLLDTVETNWRGVQDLAIQKNSNNIEESLIGIGMTSNSLGLWRCPLKKVNQDRGLPAEQFKQMLRRLDQKVQVVKAVSQSLALERLSSDSERPQSQTQSKRRSLDEPSALPKLRKHSNHVSTPTQKNSKYKETSIRKSHSILSTKDTSMNLDTLPEIVPRRVLHKDTDAICPVGVTSPVEDMRPNSSLRKGSSSIQPKNHREKEIPEEGIQNKKLSVLSKFRDDMKREKIEKREPLKEQDLNVQSLITANAQMKREHSKKANNQPTVVKKEPSQDSQKMNIDIINEMSKEHHRFMMLTSKRSERLDVLFRNWNLADGRSALNTIQMLGPNDDPTLIMDMLNMSLNLLNKKGNVNVETACVFVQKASLLIGSKFYYHVGVGIQYISKILEQFLGEILKIRSKSLMNVIDLNQVDKYNKYDELIKEFQKVRNKQKLRKLTEENKDGVGELAACLLAELDIFLNQVK